MNALLDILERAPIPTWFAVGGRADRLARPQTLEQVAQCLELDPSLRVLGDGANLLVDDDGVGELVLDTSGLRGVEIDDPSGLVVAMAGANLPKLVTETVRRGLGGIEGLGGIPASLGGALVMNAGGAFGQIAEVVERVEGMDRDGREVSLTRDGIGFGYRRSGLHGLVITRATLRLTPGDPALLRSRLRDVMAYKKSSQPMASNSAGCAFRNPTLAAAVEGAGRASDRVSAGLLIDRAGCKGLRLRSAHVSERHGNFLTADPGGRARDVIELMDEVARRVRDRFGVELEREVVVWRRCA